MKTTTEKAKPQAAPPAPQLDPIERELQAAKSLPTPPAGVSLIVAAQAEAPLCKPALLDKINELQAEWKRCQETVNASTPDKAKRAYFDNQKTLGERISAGKTADQDAWSLEDWQEDFAERMAAAKRRAADISRTAWEISRPVVMAYIVLTHQVADKLSADEKRAFDQYGIPYTPSPVVTAIRASARSAAQRVSSIPNWSSAPAHALQFLNLQ